MDYAKNFFTTLINLCYPDPKKKIVAWRQIILFILIMAIVIILAAGFCCASENKPKSQRPKLCGNYETGERFVPSLEDFFLPDDEVDDNYSFEDLWLKYTYPASKETRLSLKQRIAYKDYTQKDNYDSTANYSILGFRLRNKDYTRAFHKNVDTASLFLQWQGQLREGLNLKAKYKAYRRHYREDDVEGKDRFKHSASVGFDYWF